jgi:hypothetical protein
VAGTAVILYSSELSGLFLLHRISCCCVLPPSYYSVISSTAAQRAIIAAFRVYISFFFVAFTTTQHFSWPLPECEFVHLVFDLDLDIAC